MWIVGTVGYESSFTSGDSQNGFVIGPSFGYMLNSNMAFYYSDKPPLRKRILK